MTYGCRYCKMNKKYEEYCALTGELTNSAVMCDFEWEDCPEYIKAQEPITPSESTATPAGEEPPKLIQTSIFGAAGEKPFKE